MPRITASVDEAKLSVLAGNTPRFAQKRFDRGMVPDSTSGRLLLVMKRSQEQETALQQLLDAQQTSSSASYHKWLKPQEFGSRFGVADADVQTVSAYLASEGFQVGRVYHNKSAIEITGTAGQIRKTFHTQIHSYEIAGRRFVSNQSDPQIPKALASVVAGFASLNNFRAGTQQQASAAPQVAYDRSGGVHALYNGGTQNGHPVYGVSPGDLAKLYNIPKAAGATAAVIGVISDSNVNLAFITNYNTVFKTGATLPTVIVDGNDPGVADDSLTTLAQLELVGAVDPAATVMLYTSATTDYDTGIDFAMIRAVDDDVVNVLNIGLSQCEHDLGAGGDAFVNVVMEQAASEGISMITATGDSGSAGCDIPGASSGTEVAVNGLAVNGYASTPFATAIGGTDFYYGATGVPLATVAKSWSATNTGTPAFTSALGYIAEQAWNDSLQTNDQLVSTPTSLEGSGGGPSTAGLNGVTPYGQKSWQTVASTVSSTARVIPDLSFFAGDGQNYSAYLLCAQTSDCANSNPTFTMAGGTAAASAVFAGMAGLLIQKDGAQGNLNPELYALYGASQVTFHDVTHGTNSMACSTGTGCSNGFLSGYNAGTGYDGATGLGSLDATKFVTNWSSVNALTKTPTLTLAVTKGDGSAIPPAGIPHGTLVEIKVTAAGSAGTPTGDVVILSSSPLASLKGIETLTLSGGTANDLAFYNDYLPGGTYNLIASYPGSLTYAPAKSNAVAMTIAPEVSQVIYMSGTLPGVNNGVFTGASIPYGTPYAITVEPFGLDVNAVGIPSGSIQVFDQQTQTMVTTVPVNSEGAATYVMNQLPVGSHSLVFKYSGDASYLASTSVQNSSNGSIVAPLPGKPMQSAISFVVTTDTAATTLSASSNQVSFQNTSVTLTAVVQSSVLPNNGRAPSGSVRFSDGNSSPLTFSYDNNGNVIGVATEVVTPNLIFGGTVTYGAQYVPDGASIYSAGSPSNTVTIGEQIFGLPQTNTITTIATSTGGSSFANTSPLVFNISVMGELLGLFGNVADVSGTVTVMANGIPVGSPVTLNAGSATFTVPILNNYLQLPNGPVTITAKYNGDGTINGCFLFCPAAAQVSYGETQITITGNTGGGGSTDPNLSGDFSITPMTTAQIAGPSNPVATFGLQLTSLNNYAVNYGATKPVSLTCLAPTGLSCSFSASSTVSTLSVNLSSGFAQPNVYVKAAPTYVLASNTGEKQSHPWLPAAGGITLACVLLGGLPGRRRNIQFLLLIVSFCAIGAGVQGCGSSTAQNAKSEAGSSSKFGGSGSGNNATVSVGTYTVQIVATATTTTSIIHNTAVNVVVNTQ